MRLKNLPGSIVDACDRSFFGCDDLQTGALVSADWRPWLGPRFGIRRPHYQDYDDYDCIR